MNATETSVERTPWSVARAAVVQLRPKQWTKNVFLFAALVFSGHFLELESVIKSLQGFAAFSMLASAGYVFNDLLDREADRRHPKKRFRPIASGALPVPLALVEMVAVLAAGVEDRPGRVWSGAVLFLVADSLIGIDRFIAPFAYSEIVIVGLYTTAQFLIFTGMLGLEPTGHRQTNRP